MQEWIQEVSSFLSSYKSKHNVYTSQWHPISQSVDVMIVLNIAWIAFKLN